MSEKDHTCDTERFCYICKRSEKQTGKLIKLPNDIYVCPDCMQKSMDMVNQGYFNNFDFNSTEFKNIISVNLGKNILRTETATISVLSILKILKY